MKKRIIALLLALVMVVGMLPTVALAADAPIQDEDGYYQLTNEADLKWFRDKVNAGEGTINARLMADVTLTESWTPIGVAADYVTSYDNKPFSGIFDGNEKTISGLNVTETAGNPAALFGMAKNATIKKLVVKGTVSSTAPSGGYMPVYAGGVVGQSDGGVTLEEVASYVDVTMTNSTSNTGAIGGLAGNGYGITIKNCANYGKLTAEGSAEAHIGGLSAISPWGGKAAIENSVNVGEIVGGSTVGGLITKANDGTTVKNSATVGEPAGTLGGTFENCLATANTVGADGVEIVADMKDAKVLTTLGSAFKKANDGLPLLTWMIDNTEPEKPAEPALVDGYYQLTNEADLKWFRDKVNAGEGTINARLMADVTLTESWTPIGVAADYVTSYDNKPFSGIFDGNEKTISGLNVTETAGNPAALFGMAKNATIKKLVVKGTVSSTAPSGGYMPVYAGGVVGQSDGGVTLEEVASYVDVTMTNSTSNTGAIGGLAGNGYGITIKNCANYGKLTAEGSAEAHIGGLSAISPWGGKAAIENSVNVGEIVGGSTVGGLITKANDGTTVKNSATVGEPAGTLGGTFENCLATANTVGADGVEIVADMKDAKVLTTLGSAFKKGEKSGFPILTWMTDTEVEEPECKHEHTEPKYESKNDGTHTVTTICKDCGQTIGEAKTEDCTDKGDGTCVCGYKFPVVDPSVPEQDTDGCYQITNETQLKWFRDKVNAGKTDIKGKLMNDITLTEAWTPIGTSKNSFAGIFDGNGKTISGLHFDVQDMPEESQSLGLFGTIGGKDKDHIAIVRNLTLEGEIKVEGKTAQGFCVGAAAAYLSSFSTLSGITTNVAIVNAPASGVTSVRTGGLVGMVLSSGRYTNIECCRNIGSVTGTGETGGLIGYHSGSVSYYGEYYVAVRNSCNEGTVTGTGACTGGLIGNSWSGTKVTDCYNAGKLSGTDYVGGLAGDANETHFDYCYNTGSVSGSKNVGGLAGRIRSGHIYHSYSIGDVTGTDSETTGSLCGERGGSVFGTVQYSYALKAPVLGSKSIGLDYDEKNQNQKHFYYVVSLDELRAIPEYLNPADGDAHYKINPGKTPALMWQEIAECTHVHTKNSGIPGVDENGFYHTKTVRCEDCFAVLSQGEVERCTPEGEHKLCSVCGQICCKHENAETTYTTRSQQNYEDGKWVTYSWHTATTICPDCSNTFVGEETECAEATETYRGITAGPNAGKHRHSWFCVCDKELRHALEPCVDEKINATGAAGEDNICDLCGTAMVLAAPTAPEGDGFYPYTVKEGSKDVTHYYVTHYEVGEKAEELTVMATGKQLTYQWYYRLSEDETEAGTAIEDATEATYTPDTSAETGMRFYYCVVTNPAGSAKTGGQPVIVCKNPTATIYFSLTDDDKYVAAESSGNIMAYQKVTVPYFDLKAYHLEGNYFKSETYGPADADDPMGGSQLVAGSSAAAYGKITALHLLIWMTEREYLGVSADKAGQGYLYDEKLMGSDIFGIAASSTVGSVLIQNFWTHDMNFNYYMNYVYPLAAEGWGATADQILMRDGDIFSMMMYSDWSFYNDEWAGYHHVGNELNKTMVETQMKADASIDLTLYRSYGHDSSSYATDHVVVGSLDVYYIETSKLTSGDVTDWTKAGTVDENGKFTLDAKALKLEAGKQYLFSVAGQKGKDVDAFVSCPGGVLVNVLDADAALTWNVRFKNGKEDYAAKQVENGKLVTVENPTREGYTFTGWYTDEYCTNRFDIKTTPVTCNLMLYAGWREGTQPVTWTVTFVNEFAETTTQTVEDGKTATEPEIPTHDGYTFLGWFTDEAHTQKYEFTTAVTADLTLYAGWQVKTWTVTFKNEFADDETQIVENGKTATEPETPTHDGYTFLGWFTDEAHTQKYAFTTAVTADLMLYAGWEKNVVVKTWTVTFMDRGATYETQRVRDGETASRPADPARTGYTFTGWYTDERCTHAYLFSTPVAADLTLYAGWQRKQPTPVTPVTPVTPAKPSAPADDDLSFSDVSKDSWYYDGVKFVCGKGLMNGTGANRFSPNANTTRGMILTILARIEGVDTSGTPWYAAGQKWAMANGISDGTNMEGEITREQLAAMLYRYAKLKGYDVSASADLSGCSDAAKVNTYAVDAMRWAVAEGLIQGMGGKLNPQSTATRAQVATILMRFLELYSK